MTLITAARAAIEPDPASPLRHPDDLLGSARVAVRGVPTPRDDGALLCAIVSAAHGADTGVLPSLTSLLCRAPRPAQAHRAIDVIVRVMLSHVMTPSDTPATAAAEITWLAGHLLDPRPHQWAIRSDQSQGVPDEQ